MEKIALCRGCLNTNVHYNILNTPLEGVYENLTGIRFQTNDMRPLSVCYMCYALLLRTKRFMVKCLRAEDLLTDMIVNQLVNYNEEIDDKTSLIDRLSLSSALSVSPVVTVCTTDDNVDNGIKDSNIKQEISVEHMVCTKDTQAPESSGATNIQSLIELEEIVDSDDSARDEHCEDLEHLDGQFYEVPVEKEPQVMSQNKTSDVWINIDSKIGKMKGTHNQKHTNNRSLYKQNNNDKKINKSINNVTKLCNINDKNKFNINLDFEKRTLNNSVAYKNIERLNKKPISAVDPKSFRQKSDLVTHSAVPTGEKLYPCNLCDKNFAYKSSLLRHSHVHSGNPFGCSLCGKLFFQKAHLICHTRTHTGEQPYACSVCNKHFSQQSSLGRHLRIHTGEKPYTCTVCDRSFNQKCSLDEHVRIHTGERPYNCFICKKTFSRNSELKRHSRRHIGEKNFTCNGCDTSFTEKGSLIRHIRAHAKKPCSSFVKREIV